MNFVTMTFPAKPGVDNETRFVDVITTFMGEYPWESTPISWGDLSPLGRWTREGFRQVSGDTVRAAYFEDVDGNIFEYFVFMENGTLRHRIVGI